MRIHLLVREVAYEGVTDSEGNFAVLIPAQAAGTPIIATVTDKDGRTSDKAYATVLEAMLTFYHVPDTLAFETTKITTEPKIIKRQNPDWKILQLTSIRSDLINHRTAGVITIQNQAAVLVKDLSIHDKIYKRWKKRSLARKYSRSNYYGTKF